MTRSPGRWWRSLRGPLAAVVLLSAILVAVVFSIVADRSTMTSGLDRVRGQAQDQLGAVTATYEFTNTLPNGATVVDRDNTGAGVPQAILRAASKNPSVTFFDGNDMWAANAIDDRRILIIKVSAASLLAERDDLHRTLLAVGLVTIAIALLGSWVVATSLTSRLRRAEQWVSRGASQSLAEAGLTRDGDEVGKLVDQIDQLSSALRDRVRTEQAFTADVAHELRTPITALVNATNLLPKDHAATPLVHRLVHRLRVLVDELLELARADEHDQVISLEPVDVVGLLTEITAQMPHLAPDSVKAAGPSTTFPAEPQRLERVLVNLLANARRHGTAPVSVEVSPGRIIVRDSGAGFPDELLAAGPQRLRALGRTAGSGLGLVIAQTYADQMNADLELRNDQGAVAVLTTRSVVTAI